MYKFKKTFTLLILAALVCTGGCSDGESVDTSETSAEETTFDLSIYETAPPTDPGEVSIALDKNIDDGRNLVQIPKFSLTGQSAAVSALNSVIESEVGAVFAEYEASVGLDSTEDTVRIETQLSDDGRYVQALTSIWRESLGESGRSVYNYTYDRVEDRAVTLDDALLCAGITVSDPQILVAQTVPTVFDGGELYENDFSAFAITPGGSGAVIYVYSGYTTGSGYITDAADVGGEGDAGADNSEGGISVPEAPAETLPEYMTGIFSCIFATGERGAVREAYEGYRTDLWENASWPFPPQSGYTVGIGGGYRMARPTFDLCYPAESSFIRENDGETLLLSNGIDGMGRILYTEIGRGTDNEETADNGDNNDNTNDENAENTPSLTLEEIVASLKSGKLDVLGEDVLALCPEIRLDSSDTDVFCDILYEGAASDDTVGAAAEASAMTDTVAPSETEAEETEPDDGDAAENITANDTVGESEPAQYSPDNDYKLRLRLTSGSDVRYIILRSDAQVIPKPDESDGDIETAAAAETKTEQSAIAVRPTDSANCRIAAAVIVVGDMQRADDSGVDIAAK